MNKFVAILFSTFLCACVSSKVSVIQNPVNPGHKVETIALAPNGGVLADAVGVELSNRGFTIIDSAQISSLMIRNNINEIEVMMPSGLRTMYTNGIDAVISVKAIGTNDNQLQGASARINSTSNGKIITGITWENGHGGQEGSAADRQMKKGLSGAATEIAEAISKSLKQIQ